MRNKPEHFLLLLFCGALLLSCSSQHTISYGPVQAMGGTPKEFLTQIEIDTIQYLGSKLPFQNLGPVGGVQSLSRLLIYPEIARRAQVSGNVMVRLHINSKGKVDSSVIVSSNVTLFNQTSLDGLKQAKFFPSSDSEKVGYSALVHIRYSAINVERISINVKNGEPSYTLTILNDCSCIYITSKPNGPNDTISAPFYRPGCRYALAAMRDEILFIRENTNFASDSSMVVTYIENGHSETFTGNPELYHFWVINAIAHRVIESMVKYKQYFH
jgi:TonB family protein